MLGLRRSVTVKDSSLDGGIVSSDFTGLERESDRGLGDMFG